MFIQGDESTSLAYIYVAGTTYSVLGQPRPACALLNMGVKRDKSLAIVPGLARASKLLG